MKRKLALLLGLAMLISVCVVGCSSGTTTTTSTTPAATTAPAATGDATATAAPAATGHTTVVVRLGSIPNTLDDYRAKSVNCEDIEHCLYNFILGSDPATGAYQLEGGVLESYDVKTNDDGTCTLTMNLRDDIYFHDGSKLTGDDIIFSLQHFRDLSTSGSTVFSYMTDAKADGNVVTVQLSQPHANLLQSLTACRVDCKATWDANGDVEALNVCNGTGPYTLTSYVAGSSVECEAWDKYPDGKPAIGTIKFTRIDETTAAYMSLEAGDIDLSQISYEDVERAQSNSNVTLFTTKTGACYEMFFNCDLDMFSDVNMRKAYCFAMNKEAYLPLNGALILNDSAINDTNIFYYSDPDQPKYDPDQANQLFTSLGVTPTNRMAVAVTSYAGDPLSKIWEAYQLDLKNYGVDLEIKQLEYGAWVDAQDEGQFQLESNSWSNGTPSAYSLCKYYATAGIPGINNERFRNDRMDAIFDELTTCTDLDKQKELAQEVQTIAGENVPKYPMYSLNSYYAFDSDISNFQIDCGGLMNLKALQRSVADAQ